MNSPRKNLVVAVAAAMVAFATSPLAAAGYSKAEITRLHNDVKVLKENTPAKSAAVGQQINPVTSVATGPGSRAELRFPDKSLTRLGANSRFTLRGDARTLDLEQGVMLLQVPEQIRGAKVRTAAVTAAVTGGTALLEYLPGGYVKLIVIEGFVDVFMNGKPSTFKQYGAGQMMIMKADGTSLPEGVDVDLKALLKSSKLISGDDQSGINQDLVNQAVQQQQQLIQSGVLQPTNLVLPGQGTYVVINTDNSQVTNLFKSFAIGNGNPPEQPPPGKPPGPGGPQGPASGPGPQNNNPSTFQGVAPLISGKSILNETSIIKTHPHIDAYNVKNGQLTRLESAAGILYRGLPDLETGRPGDGVFQYFAFGDTNFISSELQPKINDPTSYNNAYWAVFKFEDLFINGTPIWDLNEPTEEVFSFTSNTGFFEPAVVTNVILASQNGVRVGANSQFPEEDVPTEAGGAEYEEGPVLDLGASELENLILYSNNGEIVISSDSEGRAIYGYGQDVSIVAAGLESDVRIEGNILLESGEGEYGYDTADLLVVAGRDVSVTSANVTADTVAMEAGRDVIVTGGTVTAKNGSLRVKGNVGVNITDSSLLKQLAGDPAALLSIEAGTGNILVENSTLEGRLIEIQALVGSVDLRNATINSSDIFRARTLGTNGKLTIEGGTFNAANIIKLYSEGSNGHVLFKGSVALNTDEAHIAGNIVEVQSGGTVNVSGSAHVFAGDHKYNHGTHGTITAGQGVHQGTLPGKPDFRSTSKLRAVPD